MGIPNEKTTNSSEEDQSSMDIITSQPKINTTKKPMTPEELALYMKNLWITKNESGRNNSATAKPLLPYQNDTTEPNNPTPSKTSPKSSRKTQNQLSKIIEQTKNIPDSRGTKRKKSSSSSSEEKKKKPRIDKSF
jgi:hypothetical protein